MKSTIFAAALVVAGFVLPAQATPQLKNLLTTVQRTGTEVVVDGPNCRDPQTFGYYSYQRNVVDRLTICLTNHRGDSAELRDTVLHESVHVAQACKGGNLFTAASILRSALPEELNVVNTRYSQAQAYRELEARVIAREQDEVFVQNLIEEHCFN